MSELMRSTTEGDLKVAGSINTRLPIVADGLIAHFPFDGKGGAFDAVGGHSPSGGITAGINYADVLDWRNPSNWGNIDSQTDATGVTWDESLQALRFTGNIYRTLKTPIVIDSAKTYTVSMEILQEDGGATPANQLLYIGGHRENASYQRTTSNYDYSIKSGWYVQPLNTWITVTKTYSTGSVRYPAGWLAESATNPSGDTLTKFWWFGGLWNYNTTGVAKVLLRNLKITITDSDTSNVIFTEDGVAIEEATSNVVPNPAINSYPTIGNGWGTYNTNQYNSNTYFSIGTISGVTSNIVTLATIGRPIYTYDVLRPQTTGGGVTAGTDYFVKKLSDTTFSLHAYDGSQDGSKGFRVYDSIKNDVRVAINATNFPTMWFGAAHLPNSALVKEIIPKGFKGIHDCLRLHGEHKPQGEQDYMAYGVTTPVTSGLVYTFSFWVRAVTAETIGKTISLNGYTAGYWAFTLIGGSTTFTDFEWHKLVYTGTAPNTGNTSLYFPFGKCGTIDIAEIQCEQKGYATSFTTTSRSDGRLGIPITLSSECTINFDYYYDGGVSNTIISNAQYNSKWWGIYHDSAGGIYMHEGASGNSISSGYTQTKNTWVNITIEWSATTQYLYIDGVQKCSLATTGSTNSANIPIIYLGWGWNIGNGIFRNLSIYNRVLSDSEIKKISNGFNLTSKNVIANKIISKPNYIPNDVVYFPLSINTKAYNSLMLPNSEANVVFDDTGVWVGTAITNEFTYPTFNFSSADGGVWGHWGQTGASGTYGQNTDKVYIYHKERIYSHWVANASGATGDFLLYQSPAFAGGLRSLQAIICMSDFSAVTNSKVYPAWNARNGGIANNAWSSIERIGDSYWYLCKAEGISQDGTNDLVGIYVKPGYKIYVDQTQLEQRPYCSPFVIGTSGTSDLEFNFYRDLGLDWNGNWSIVYWKKPIGTDTSNNLAGYNIESLGCNGNSVGGGYIWYGKASGSDSINSASPGTIAPSDYFNKWHMVSLVKNGGTLTIKDWNIGGQTHTRTQSYGTIYNNYFVTQYGYDFKLGGWDDVNVCNTYFRDLIVAKRALTDAELTNLNSQKININHGVMQIQGNFKTGEIF